MLSLSLSPEKESLVSIGDILEVVVKRKIPILMSRTDPVVQSTPHHFTLCLRKTNTLCINLNCKFCAEICKHYSLQLHEKHYTIMKMYAKIFYVSIIYFYRARYMEQINTMIKNKFKL
jgi:hypothetical protein